MSMLEHCLAKGVEWGSLSDDEEEQQEQQQEEEDDGFSRPKTRNARKKKKDSVVVAADKIYLFSDIWTWTETPFQLQAILSSEAEMERTVKKLKLKWAHAYSPAQQMIWNFHKGKRTLHLPTPEYLARFDSHIV